MAKRQTAKQAAEARLNEIEKTIAKISKTMKAERKNLNDPGFNWANAGDIAYTAHLLQQASDFIHSEGEYAA